MNQKQFFSHLENTFKSALKLVKKKNADYAEESDPFKNFKFASLIGMSVEDAILVRVSDKMARISNLIRNNGGKTMVKDESIDDTCIDIINYIAIMMAYRENEKQKRSQLGGGLQKENRVLL